MANAWQAARARLAHPFRLVGEAGWIYPFWGIWYYVTNPFLFRYLKGRMLPCFLLSLFVLANLFVWAYLPQVALLYLFHREAAWFNATVLVLSEGAAIVALLLECFFVDETQVDIFDAVLVAEGYDYLVATRRHVDPEGRDPGNRLGPQEHHAVYYPFSLRQTIEFIVLLPLNFIPVVGSPMFIFLCGYRAGPLQQYRYFKFLGMDKKARKQYVRYHRWKYTWFGTGALLLQLIPVLNMLFLLSTTVGSALLAIQMEEKRIRAHGEVAQGHTTDEEASDDPPPYSDEGSPQGYGTIA
ncbi:hypothetical protein IWX90DRAFT_444531 [Phyllosticta citrichinensis]|uniref:Uncharacterized protein n=1 Tax=Phyllosticta citrichinensis TaxID=1130410 RepID=A0ABR1XHS6_9PEZI